MRLVVGLALVCVQTVIAQSASRAVKARHMPPRTTSAPDMVIRSLSIMGNEHIPANAILKVSGLKVGDRVTKEMFDAARQRLADSGFFESVGYQYSPVAGNFGAYTATITVKEVSPLYKVEFVNLPGSDADLNSYLSSRDPLYQGFAPPTQAVLDRWAQLLDAFSAEKSRPKKVIGKLILVSPDHYIVRFQNNEPAPSVAGLRFSGNEAVDDMTLQKTLGTVAYGTQFTPENFRELLENQLRPLYDSRGYLQAKFQDIAAEPAPPPTKGVIVSVRVVEGPVYKIGQFRITGITSDDRDRLLRATALKTGETANFDQLARGLSEVKRLLQRSGYYHAKADAVRKLNDTAKTVDLTIQVESGPRYQFGTLTVKGLDLNGEAAVRKLWAEKPGDPFNADYPNHFLSRLKEENLFDYLGSTGAEVRVNEDTHTADVILSFTASPAPTGRPRRRPS